MQSYKLVESIDGEENHANSSHKKAGIAVLIPDKVEFKTKTLPEIKGDIFFIMKQRIFKKIFTGV